MNIEHQYGRHIFDLGEIVELRQMCLTAGKVFPPGKYIVGELPEIAFELGLVDRLPSVKGRSDRVMLDKEA